jgi:DNA/RNA endonuclease G (NUC1)
MKLYTIMLTPLISFSALANESITSIDHGYYLSVMDCETKNPLAVIYQLTQDTGIAKRYGQYLDDERLKIKRPDCHPNTDHKFKTYQSVLKSKGIKDSYDVGHLAMSNHLDHNDESVKMANYFSNLSPQAAKSNRNGGAWYETELITECQRQHEELYIVVGTIDDPLTNEKDYFVDTYGQTTADYWFRLIYFKSSRAYQAWIIPNNNFSTREKLLGGQYTVTAQFLDSKLSINLPILQELNNYNIPVISKSDLDTTSQGAMLTCRGEFTELS